MHDKAGVGKRPAQDEAVTALRREREGGPLGIARREAGNRAAVTADPNRTRTPGVDGDGDGISEAIPRSGDLTPSNTSVSRIIDLVAAVARTLTQHRHAVASGINVSHIHKVCNRGPGDAAIDTATQADGLVAAGANPEVPSKGGVGSQHGVSL